MMGFFSKFGKKKEFCITSPISGQAISAQEIEDETFAAGLLGYTVGILRLRAKHMRRRMAQLVLCLRPVMR